VLVKIRFTVLQVPRQLEASNDCALHVLINARTIMRSPESIVALVSIFAINLRIH
jgi:hypothetical protein